MLELRVDDNGGIGRLIDRYREVALRLRDMADLAERVRAAMVAEVELALRSGRDRAGDLVDDIKESTAKRRLRGGRGSGPARVPDEASGFLAGLRSGVRRMPAGYLVSVWWEGPTASYLRYHVEGTTHMAARDPVGLSPAAIEGIRRDVRDWVDSVLAA